MIRSDFPVFVKVKSVSTRSPSVITPKSCSFLSNEIIAKSETAFAVEDSTAVVDSAGVFLVSLPPHETSDSVTITG